MLKAPRLLLFTATAGLVVLSSGCYTQLAGSNIERRYPNTGIIVEEKTDTAAVDRFAPGDRVYASSDAAAKTAAEEPVADERTYVESRYTGGLSDEYVLRDIDPEDTIDNGHLGYTHQEVLTTDDSGMVVNNYYFDTNPWYDSYRYWDSYYYDPWDPWWGGSYVYYRPSRYHYRPSLYLSFGYSWYDPWDPWYDPWYDPWDFIAWDYYYYPRYTYWHPYRPYHYYAWSSYDYGYLHGYNDGYYYGGGSSWVDIGSGNRREDRMAGMNDGVRQVTRASGSNVETAVARQTVDPVATNSVERATRRSQPAGVTDAARSASSYTTGTTPSTYTRRVSSRSDYIGSYSDSDVGASRTTTVSGAVSSESRTRSTGSATDTGQARETTSLQQSTVTTRRIAPESTQSSSTSRGTYTRTTPETRSSSSSSTSTSSTRSSSTTQSTTTSRSTPTRSSSQSTTTSSSAPRTTTPAPSTPSRSSGSTTRSSGSSSSGSSSTRSSGSSGSSSRSSGSSGSSSSSSSGSSGRRR